MIRYRARDIPAIPLFLFLHLLFILTSLVVRIVESLRQTRPLKLNPLPPKHVAIVLASHIESEPDLASRGDSKLRRAVVQSIRRSVEWASDEGVSELSIWNKDGLVQRCKQEILEDVVQLPPSPPLSGSSSPTKGGAACQADMLSPEVSPSSHTFTVYASTSRPITLHLLPLSSSTIIPDLTRKYVATGRPINSITQKTLDSEIRASLGFKSDPDLLIVHPISPMPFFRALLPRAPPELHGYPFWPLRITEIYQHPTRLPIPHSLIQSLSILLSRAQVSSLPLLRKASRLFPTAEAASYERSVGAMSRDEWQGAMSAWGQVEQRLGK